MQIINYLEYFFYLASNWDIKIATHVITNEIKGEIKYGLQSTGAVDLEQLEKMGVNTVHSNIYMPASYDLLEELFSILKLSDSLHFIDIGCGKGRALAVAAHFGATKMTGVEFVAEFCDRAKLNLLKKKEQLYPFINFKILKMDARAFEIPADADCIIMFNPFDEETMEIVLKNIEISLQQYKREIKIVYINPVHKHLFLNKEYDQVFHYKKLDYLEAIILKKAPVKTGAEQ